MKNGSNARAATPGLIPVPVSVTVKTTCSPGGKSPDATRRSSAPRFAVPITSCPPSGMASRALMTRLSSALSSWFGSHKVGHRSPWNRVSSRIAGPTVRRNRSAMSDTSRLARTALGLSVCRREKASRRCVNAAARLADVSPASM